MASPVRNASTRRVNDGTPTGPVVERIDGSAARAHVRLTELSLVLMSLIWGVNYVVVKYGTTVLDPLAFNGVRVALAAGTLLLVAQLVPRGAANGAASRWPARRDALVLLGLGTLGNGLYQIFFVEGIARTRAGDAALVVAASPALIALIGRLRGTERVSLRGLVGIALSIGGIGLVVFGAAHGAGTHGASLLGDFLVLCGTLFWAIYTVLLQPYTHRIGAWPLSALTMLGGAIPLLIVAAPAIVVAQWSAVPAIGWAALTYSGLGALVLAYLFWYRGVRVIGPTRTAMFSNLQPLFAVLVAWIVLGETPTIWQGVGAVSIMSGLLLTRA
jgi:drug/metabolite transporter (DMT)-like permease